MARAGADGEDGDAEHTASRSASFGTAAAREAGHGLGVEWVGDVGVREGLGHEGLGGAPIL